MHEETVEGVSRRRALIGMTAAGLGVGALGFPQVAAAATTAQYNVQLAPYEARGDGVADDARAIQEAINAANGAGGGIVYFPAGTYRITRTLIVDSGISLVGAGTGATTIKLGNGANCDIVRTDEFEELTGTNEPFGPERFGFYELELDGNAANNSSGRGIAAYGKSWKLRNVVVARTAGTGIYSEWYSGGDDMEADIVGFKVIDAGDHGIEWRGPHDSTLVDGQVIRASTYGILTDSQAAGAQFVNVHVWGEQQIAWNLRHPVYMVSCQGEGSTVAHLKLDVSNVTIVGSHFFGGEGTPAGILVGDESSEAFPSECLIDARISDVPGPAISFVREGSQNVFRLYVRECVEAVEGTPKETDDFHIHTWDDQRSTYDIFTGWVDFSTRRMINERAPDTAGSAQWYKVGTLLAEGLGGRMVMEIVAANGYGSESRNVGRAFVVANIGDGGGAPNISGFWYALHQQSAVLDVKAKETRPSTGRSAEWDLYVRFATFIGDNGIDVKTSGRATFTFDPEGIGSTTGDPGAASSTVRVFINELGLNAPVRIQRNAVIRSGTGRPEGSVLGERGDLWLRVDGGSRTTLYVRESGEETNTGWVAK